ncbi:hypothetical protein R1flu_020259 [Riccia fluitans]|uniref:Centrosomal protein of 44 kDa n=1 Tax=Riccia fluitans TaxID=41844 RepID=A0ABD1ZN59_9MARC
MATGDLRGNLERLRMQLLSISYPHPFDVQGLKQGIPAVVLPLLHYALLGFSRHVARYLSASGYELYAKSDLRFMESALRFFRHEFNYRCALTIAQIFSRGYAERKMIFIHDVIQAELTQINYDTLSGCCSGISNLKNPRIQSADHSGIRKLKPWEHTLRTTENSARCSKEPNCLQIDVPVVPVSEPTSPRSRNIHQSAEYHQQNRTAARNNIPSSGSPVGMGAKTSSAKVKRHVTYEDDLRDVRPRTSTENSGEDLHSHEEICRRIMEMAERLEARFSTLEAGVTRAKETLQEKLVSLEGRVRNLEASKQRFPKSSDLSRRNSKEQDDACTIEDLSQRRSPGSTSTKRDQMQQKETSTCAVLDMLRPKCNEHAWSLHQKLEDTRHCERPCSSLVETVTGVPAQQPLSSEGFRDISNTHQLAVRNSINDTAGAPQTKFRSEEYTRFNQPEPVTSTQDLIAGVRARFNRTLELLSQEAQSTNPAARSC